MKIEIVAKEIIKPSSPTPKTFNLSFLDQRSGYVYTKMFFFYKNNSSVITEEMIAGRIRCLKSSLAEVLTHFYPFAGRMGDKFSIPIGDNDGTEFVDARVNSTLTEYLTEPDVELFAQLAPSDYWESLERPLLTIQASFFTCGGLAIGINIAHKVSDASTFTSFVNSWAKTAVGKVDCAVKPEFSGSLFFPPSDKFPATKEAINQIARPNVVVKRFVFSAPKIVSIQIKVSKLGIQPPSPVQTISSFIWRIAMRMSISKTGFSKRPSMLFLPMNLRKLLPPPICEQSFGNLVEYIIVRNQSGDTEIQHLASLLGEKIAEFRKTYENKLLRGGKCYIDGLISMEQAEDLTIKSDEMNNFTLSGWCSFPIYDADFGWGKPIWVATYNQVPYTTVLIYTPNGTGIEAWVSLPADDMALFENDKELLTYATPNPSVLHVRSNL